MHIVWHCLKLRQEGRGGCGRGRGADGRERSLGKKLRKRGCIVGGDAVKSNVQRWELVRVSYCVIECFSL